MIHSLRVSSLLFAHNLVLTVPAKLGYFHIFFDRNSFPIAILLVVKEKIRDGGYSFCNAGKRERPTTGLYYVVYLYNLTYLLF